MQVVEMSEHCKVHHLQINFYQLVKKLTSLIIGFNVLEKIIHEDRFYTNRRCKSYLRKTPYLLLFKKDIIVKLISYYNQGSKGGFVS